MSGVRGDESTAPAMAGIPCCVMRGGTSKAVIVERARLPPQAAERDQVLLALFGSPDRRQIDGLGGADPLTSKVAIVGPPSIADADIDYLFGQVVIDRAVVDYGGYCGNVLSAVAAYAVNEGYVSVEGPIARVRVHVVNTGRRVLATVPVADGRAAERGSTAIAGVPGHGAPITLDFAATAGSVTGRLLPSGSPRDTIEVDGVGTVTVSVVDMANPFVFVDGAAFGVDPTAGPDVVDRQTDLLAALERIRRACALRWGVFDRDGGLSDNIPLIALVDPPASYRPYGSPGAIPATDMHFRARAVFMGGLHKAYGVGDTICTAIAALIPGTVVHAIAAPSCGDRDEVRFGHPSGVISVRARLATGDGLRVERAEVVRTARLLMRGVAFPSPTAG